MSSPNDNSLLGFLKQKSLFANSPLKGSRKRSRSKSRDSRNGQKVFTNSFAERSVEESLIESRTIPVNMGDSVRQLESSGVRNYAPFADSSIKFQYNTPLPKGQLQRTNQYS